MTYQTAFQHFQNSYTAWTDLGRANDTSQGLRDLTKALETDLSGINNRLAKIEKKLNIIG